MSPCSNAMIKDVLTVLPDDTVENVLNIFQENDIRSVPVVDDQGKFLGIFGLRHILVKLLPASVVMEDGLENLEFLAGGAPGIAKKLKKLYPLAVKEAMDPNPLVLHEDTATWEAVRVMALRGSPIAIVDEETNKFIGMISRQTLLKDLHRLMKQLDDE